MISDSDEFYRLSEWPETWRRLMLARKLGYNSRYRLLWFLLTNGLRPEVAEKWVLAYRDFDNAARKHVSSTIKDFELGLMKGSPIYSFNHSRVI